MVVLQLSVGQLLFKVHIIFFNVLGFVYAKVSKMKKSGYGD